MGLKQTHFRYGDTEEIKELEEDIPSWKLKVESADLSVMYDSLQPLGP